MTTMGKYRHFSQTSTVKGHFAILAIDHRSNLHKMLSESAGTTLTDDQFMDFKTLLMQHVLPPASGLLADPSSSIGVGIAQRLIAGHQGIIAPIEVTNYDIHPSQRDMNWIPNWSVTKLKQMGGAGVKMLLPYHPESDTAGHKRQIVADVIQQCADNDIPYYLEPIAHSLNPDETLSNAELLEVVIEMAKIFGDMGVDCLKMQFPVDAKQSMDMDEWQVACEKLNNACDIPWALLSAGVTYDTFEKQAKVACQAGANGVIVGRAVWAEAIKLHGEERVQFLETTARQRMDTLAQICEDYASPWYERVQQPNHGVTWYEAN